MKKLIKAVVAISIIAGSTPSFASVLKPSSPTETAAGITFTFIGYGSDGKAVCNGPLGPAACLDIATWLQRGGHQIEPNPPVIPPVCEVRLGFLDLSMPECTSFPRPKEPFSCLAPHTSEAVAYCNELSKREGIVF